MRRTGHGFIVAAALAFSVPVLAQKPAGAPANATAQCTDGTFSTAHTEKGACSKHGGVKTWFGAAATAAPAKGETKKETAKEAAASKKAAPKEPGTPASSPSASAGTAPAGSTGQCSDGTYTKAKTQAGACSKHGGVKTWFAANTPASAATASPKNAPVAAPKNAPSPAAAGTATPAAPAPAPTAAPKPAPTASTPGSSGKAHAGVAPTGAPADATGQCKDGTFTTSKTHSGACSHHGGVAKGFS